MEKLLLIDGSSLLHRAFYALPLLANGQGQYTNGVHGFMMMFNRLVKEEQPAHIVVCFDKSRVSFRTKLFAAYKGTRKETPEELRGQFALLQQVLTAAGIQWLELDDYEADDLLGSLAVQGAAQGLLVDIFSGDKDILQLIGDQVRVFLTKKGISDIELWDEDTFREKYGVEPCRLTDIKGLMGDSSDNIPGVPGVGEKTALKLLGEYGSMEALYENLPQIKQEKLRQKLTDNREQAFLSRTLATIDRQAPVVADWQSNAYQPERPQEALRQLYQELGLRQLLRGLDKEAAPSPTAPQAAAQAVPPPLTDQDAPWPVQQSVAAALPALCEGDWQEIADLARQQKSCSVICAWQGSPVQGDLTALAMVAGEKLLFAPGEQAVQLLPQLKAVLEDGSIAKITANSKELQLLLAAHGVALSGVCDDVIIAAYLLDPAAGAYDLAALAEKNGLSWPALAAPAAAARMVAPLAQALNAQLRQNGMEKLYQGMELPLCAVLADMEQAGIRVEGQKLSAMSQTLQQSAEEYQEQIYALAGHAFNLNSTKQLAVVLFEEMGIAPVKKTKTGYSTDAEVLEQLALSQPIAALLLEYRLVTKLRSTYTDGLRALIDPKTGKLHTSFKQTVTATGRLSSAEPNLQNIPVRHELGRRIRQVFVPDQPGDLLLAVDYNQIELRVLAHISGDQKLLQAFAENEDIHTRTASEVFGVPLDQVDRQMRRNAKAVNFGIVYGISDFGLSRDLGVSRKEAGAYIEKYFARYPQVAAYQQATIAAGRKNGYVTTICGRRRLLPELDSRNHNLRSFAERMAINTPIQGSAADIIKIAMLNIAAQIRQRGLRSQMLLQVHDELIFNMVPEERQILPQLVKDCMEQAMVLDVPLTVDCKVGPDWYHLESLPADEAAK